MNTPFKLSLFDFIQTRGKWIEEFAVCTPNGVLCKECRNKIMVVHTAVSVHDARFTGCTGAGQVILVDVPFCPVCDPPPALKGCVHENPTQEASVQIN